ncbi:MAG: response regulator, partial [Gammaproteobacteria bacterium]|nr:response regulator [Gammaproteobacteria bacterium]
RYLALPKGNESILVVDDEPDLLKLVDECLSALGYKVSKAATAAEALSMLKKEKYDLIFSDIVMPGGMNGYELAEKVSKEYPEIKILLSSGYTGNTTSVANQNTYKNQFIKKPYTRQDVANRVRASIDE